VRNENKVAPQSTTLEVTMLEPDKVSARTLKAFATHIAKVEADTGIKADRILIKGIPPFQDVATASFKIPRDRLGRAVEGLLNAKGIKPDILINGIPGNPHLDLKVSVGKA
jgi:hypothetical protein